MEGPKWRSDDLKVQRTDDVEVHFGILYRGPSTYIPQVSSISKSSAVRTIKDGVQKLQTSAGRSYLKRPACNT